MSDQIDALDHPIYGKPLSGRRVVSGVEFISYRFGVNRYTFCTADGRVEVRGAIGYRGDWHVAVDGVWLPSGANPSKTRRFRLFTTAAAHGLKLAHAKLAAAQ